MRVARWCIPVVFFFAAAQILTYAGVGFWMRWGVIALAAFGGFFAVVAAGADVLESILTPNRD